MIDRILAIAAAASTAVFLFTSVAPAQTYSVPTRTLTLIPGPNDPCPRQRCPVDNDRPEPTDPKVCFYSEVEFKGQHFCVTESTRTPFVEDAWKDRIASIRVFEHANVKVCSEPSLRGSCLYVGFYKKSLPDVLNNHVYSFKIQ